MKHSILTVSLCLMCVLGLCTSCETVTKIKNLLEKAEKVKDDVNDAVDTYNEMKEEYKALVGDEDEADEAIRDQDEMQPDDSPLNTNSRTANADPAAPGNEFLYLSQRLVDESDISGLTKEDLRVLRNAIYARHGYKFKSADLREFFSRYSWYQPRYDNVESQLNRIERKNVAFIKAHE
ncbi:MAG: YARHG domain-containing protein [Prevotella sp.]|nr:YARHG domain-containing protein [Prevotella sp.]MBQ8657492.1 YARHG domain-containing protein [Prevotella sp.]